MGVLKSLPVEILTGMLALVVTILIFVIKNFFKHMKKDVNAILREIKLLRIDFRSTDYALQEIHNGEYEGLRDKEKDRLMRDAGFLDKKDS